MRRSGNSSTLKRVILILAILLALSLAALCILIRYYNTAPSAQVSGNRITTQTVAYTQAAPQRAGLKPLSASAAAQDGYATAIALDKRVPDYAEPFYAGNMFPGDGTVEGDPNIFCDYRNYRVQVYHTGTVTVHFSATVQTSYAAKEGEARLVDVLGLRVKVRAAGESAWTVLYEGLLQDMPASVDTALSGKYLDYQMTPYLATSVGNAYQAKELAADFRWWVEGKESHHGGTGGGSGDDSGGQLVNGPKTGDSFSPLLWGGLGACAVIGLGVVVVLRRRKEERR